MPSVTRDLPLDCLGESGCKSEPSEPLGPSPESLEGPEGPPGDPSPEGG